jgi:Clostripain family
MSGWTIVVSAAVTFDLKDAINADLREARVALEAMPDADIRVHVYLSGPAFNPPQTWSWPPPRPGRRAQPLEKVLADPKGWAHESRGRMLILWGHGSRAFQGTTGTRSATLVSKLEDLGPDVATPTRIHRELDNSLAPDIIGYDACRMASLTTVQKLAESFPKALFIGSMVPEPASGWPYFDMFGALGQKGWGPRAVANALVEAYAASVDTDDWCLVVLDLGRLVTGGAGLDDDELGYTNTARTSLNQAIQDLIRSAPPDPVTFYAAAEGADILDDTNMADLGALMRRLDVFHPNAEARAVRQALRGAILARRAAGNLAGRDGLAVRVGLPPPWVEAGDPAWPAKPGWSNYLPELVPNQD